ncbi:phosphoribosyltransferase family protein [Saccharomonospora sp. NPDC006951]
MQFENRADAGRELADRLGYLSGRHPIVLGLPRGGAVVARQVADGLGAAMDVLLVHRVSAPERPELVVGAVGEGGVLVTNADLLSQYRLSRQDMDIAVRTALTELDRRTTLYRRGLPPLEVAGRTVVLVDDAIATGATVRAALRVLHGREAGRVVLAVPVAPADVLEELAHNADHTVCPNPRVWMRAVGHWYRDFPPVSDEDVLPLLDRRTRTPKQAASPAPDL